jgi:predicted transcriptional regulator of viral defense system
MSKPPVLKFIKQIRRPVFTTYEISALSGKSASATTQALNYLEREGILVKIYRGIWAEAGHERLTPFVVIPYLFPRHRAYVSFVSALHMHGMIEQIPQVITVASTAHTRTIKTRIGTYSVHQLAPSFFAGFHWYKKEGHFLIAEPEKALIDSLYLSAHKKRQFAYFPELHFPKPFSFKRAEGWAKRISDPRIRKNVQLKLTALIRKF